MNDRKLLEMSAKAANIDVYESNDGTLQNRPILAFSCGGSIGTLPYEVQWNPLNDDMQAFQLMVKLGISIIMGTYKVCAELIPQEDECNICVTENYNSNTGLATRRAIVRVAAEIGANQ